MSGNKWVNLEVTPGLTYSTTLSLPISVIKLINWEEVVDTIACKGESLSPMMMGTAFSEVFPTKTWATIIAEVVTTSVLVMIEDGPRGIEVSDWTTDTTLSPSLIALFATAFPREAGGIVIFYSTGWTRGRAEASEGSFLGPVVLL